MRSGRARRAGLASAVVLVSAAGAGSARAQERAAGAATAPAASDAACRCRDAPEERRGGRVGVGLDLGAGLPSGRAGSDAGFAVGASLRFGGAFTDRVHVLGEFSLGGVLGGPSTAFYGALDVHVQGYIGPSFYVRGGLGVAELVGFQGSAFYYTLPGPRLTGAAGYDLYRVGDRSFALEARVSHAFLNGGAQYNALTLATLGVNIDFY